MKPPRRKPPALQVSVAVCTYDRYPVLAECLAGLARQSMHADRFEVLVVDNSPDPQRSLEESRHYEAMPNLRWLYEATPGLSNARNVAMRKAAAPIIAYIDDDAVPHTEWVVQLARAYDVLGKSVAGIGGRVVPRFASERPAWLSDKLLAYLSVVDLGDATRPLRDDEWVAGANVSYRVEALRSVGGFSPALGRVGGGISLMSNDETELAERLAAAGGAMGYAGRAVVDHLVEPGRLYQNWFRRRFAWQAVSDYVRRPAEQLGRSSDAWIALKKFLAHQTPDLRTQRALAIDQAESGALEWQLAAIYEAITCLLSGVGERDD